MERIGASQLRRALEAGFARVLEQWKELNRTNVFPVADGDTGTNLVQTLLGAYRRLKEHSLPRDHAGQLLQAWAHALLFEARGNSGVLFSQFVLGLAHALKERPDIGISEWVQALEQAREESYRALARPVEGTILTVIRTLAEQAPRISRQATGVREFWDHLVREARKTLHQTPEWLPVLKQHGVLDAGAQGFVLFLEGFREALYGKRVALDHLLQQMGNRWHRRGGARQTGEPLTHRFCTEAVLRPRPGLDIKGVRSALTSLGDSLIVVGGREGMHIHIHTSSPEQVWAVLEGLGTLEMRKVDDMAAQQKKDFPAFAMDTGLDLPPEVAFDLGVLKIPVQVYIDGQPYRVEGEIHTEDVVRALEAGHTVQTSQPSPADFERAFREGLSRRQRVVSFHLPAALSGTVSTGQQVAARLDPEGRSIVVRDSRFLSYGGGLVLLMVYDLLLKGIPLDEALNRVDQRAQEGFVLLTLPTMKYLVRSGRLTRQKGWIARVLGLRAVLEYDTRTGALFPYKLVAPWQDLNESLFRLALKRMDPDVLYDVAVPHTTRVDPEARALLARLQQERRVRRAFTGAACPAITVHLGPGALAIMALPVDPVLAS